MSRGPDRFRTSKGERIPAGATVRDGGINFSVFSRHATAVTLLLFDGPGDDHPFQTVELDPRSNRTFFFWHVFVEGATAGLYYSWQADGPRDTARTGFRFDRQIELLDPWARAVDATLWDRRLPFRQGRSNAIRGRVVDDSGYDWEGDAPLRHRFEDTVIYEMHVGGFTRHPNSGVAHVGTFDAVVEKIPYLIDLGITDVELMPVMAFDTQDVPESVDRRGLGNFWGYSTYGFWAPHPEYASGDDASREFRDMVKALHRAGIGVILDVVFNHTSEGGDGSPVIHFKGLGNETFYHLDPVDRRRYRDYTGCGNTVNCNHPVVADYIVRCLEYWVEQMHVDGFRFDLASAMARGENGVPMYHAPVLWAIEFSPVLTRTRLIAEAWDAAGLYQVGDFPGYRWAEWNGRYRDVVRRSIRGDPGMISELATRLTGSSDLHEGSGKLPVQSVNYVTCHDGFTLWDLVSYNRKHNEGNGEENRDGSNDNLSWNHGAEGETDDPAILGLRRRVARNAIALLFVSQGLPMIHNGDEVLRTKSGNNNTYCQDNPIGWFDWSLVEKNADMHRFTRLMIAFRKRHRSVRRRHFLTGKASTGRAGQRDIVWYGIEGPRVRWDDDRVLGFALAGQSPDEGDIFVMMNFSDSQASIGIPPAPGHAWYRAVDTALGPPDDIAEPEAQQRFIRTVYRLESHTVAILESRPDDAADSRPGYSRSKTIPASGGNVTGIENG
jgi:glycogen operon protein